MLSVLDMVKSWQYLENTGILSALLGEILGEDGAANAYFCYLMHQYKAVALEQEPELELIGTASEHTEDRG